MVNRSAQVFIGAVVSGAQTREELRLVHNGVRACFALALMTA